ncbi:MAG: zinc-ribbon domain-containing protein, partial [Candidatus Aminicenantes bacterium]
MNCRRCGTDNPEGSRYCSACGALLTKSLAKPRRTVPPYVIAGAGMLIVLVAAYFLVPGFRPSSRPAAPADRAGEPAAASPEASGGAEALAAPPSFPLVAGLLTVESAVRGASSSIESTFFDGAWTALPLWAFMGPA